jgi:poly-gamma-glutamate capsule biosynthesis protein CapA/YwtB (metallophosphatase superfamily)
VLRRADLTAVNYEGTLATGGASKCLGTGTSQCFAFRAPPENAAALRRAGVDLVNLANNHAHDFGPAGMHETAQALRRHGIGVTGRPSEVLLTRSRGVRVAVVGFSTYPWSASMRDLAAVRALVRQAAARADVVIALMHAGAEGVGRERTPLAGESYLGEDRGDVRAFAHTAVHAGADLVLGSGPHVLRGLELYRGRVVAYSLGNLAGYHTFSSRGTMSLSGVLRVTLDPRGRYPGGRFTSLVLDPASIPRVDRRQAAGRLVSQLGRADFGSRALVVDAAGRIRALRSEPPPAGAQDPRT